MESKDYQICTKCVMDTTDPKITFDENGVCSHCQEFEEVTSKKWFPNDIGLKKLESIYKEIKKEGVNKEYDCILGLSGGIDSSYLALKLYEVGIRPLVVHVDAGWNSELAVGNIEKIINYCGWHLHTIVINWEEMKDLHLAYLKSGVSNQDVPQDHVFFASLYSFAVKNNVRHVMSGGNIATECIFPKAWEQGAMDSINLKAIHKKFGKRKLKSYKTVSFFEYYFYYPFIKKMSVVKPLNYMPYIKDEALEELKSKIGYVDYGRKHGESIFTKFFQNYYQPTKFGYDKRKPHLSSMIVTGQITRSNALEELSKPLYDENELNNDIEYFCKKLGINNDEFNELMKVPNRDYRDYKSNQFIYKIMKKAQRFILKITGKEVSRY